MVGGAVVGGAVVGGAVVGGAVVGGAVVGGAVVAGGVVGGVSMPQTNQWLIRGICPPLFSGERMSSMVFGPTNGPS